jgi:hypothetical protein
MKLLDFRTLVVLSLTGIIASCATLKKTAHTQQTANISSLHYLGDYKIPFAFNFQNTTVGGLSGIDYDASNKTYFLICDDRSDINPARFYTAAIFLTENGIDSVTFTGVFNLLRPNGKPYPNRKQDPYQTPDPEAIRLNPLTQQLVWSSEGESVVNKKDGVLVNPAITTVSKQGNYISSFILPANFEMQTIEKGPRQNGGLEGITYTDNYTAILSSMEEPMYEDGPRADTFDNKAYIRIAKFDMAGRKNTRQYGYKLDPVAHPPIPAGAFKVNGVSDILAIGKNKLLVIERSFSIGYLGSTIKLFIADLNNATDIKNTIALQNNTDFVPATKNLLLNMDDLGIYIDNIEGVTFGPTLANGHKTLIFIEDNNFSPLQQSKLLLFEVIE